MVSTSAANNQRCFSKQLTTSAALFAGWVQEWFCPGLKGGSIASGPRIVHHPAASVFPDQPSASFARLGAHLLSPTNDIDLVEMRRTMFVGHGDLAIEAVSSVQHSTSPVLPAVPVERTTARAAWQMPVNIDRRFTFTSKIRTHLA